MPQGKRNEESKINQVPPQLVRRFEILDNFLRSYIRSDSNLPSTPGPSRSPKTLDNSRNKNYAVQYSKIEDCKAFGQCLANKFKNLDLASALDLEQQILNVLINPEIENNNENKNNPLSPAVYTQDEQSDDVSILSEPNELVIKEQAYINEEPENIIETNVKTPPSFENHNKIVLEKSYPNIAELSEETTQRLPERKLRISITSDNDGETEEIVKDVNLVKEPLQSYIDNLSPEKKFNYIDLTGPVTFNSEKTEFDRRRRFVSLEMFDEHSNEIHSSSMILEDIQSSQDLTPESENLTRKERKKRLKVKQQQERKKNENK